MAQDPEPSSAERAPDEAALAVEAPPDTDPGFIARIAAAMSESDAVTKSARNTEQGYNYASAEAILAAVRLPLLRRGIILKAQPRDYVESEIRSRAGTAGTRVVIAVDFTFTADDGELLIEGWRGEGQDYGDKAYGKAYTNALKTLIRAQWLLPTDTGDDPEASSPGERLAAGHREPELPPWARPATAARKAELVNALELLIGRDKAKELGKTIASTLGHVPDVVVSTAKGLAAHYAAAPPAGIAERHAAAFEAQAAAAERDRQDATAEATDAPAPEPGPDAPPPDEPDEPAAEEVDAEPVDDLELELGATAGAPAQDDTAPAPGTVELPLRKDGEAPVDHLKRLRAAGCTCPQPLADVDEPRKISDGCPLSGHGIPF